MSDDQRIKRLERTVNALRNSLLLLYNDTEQLALEIEEWGNSTRIASIKERLLRNKNTLETLRELRHE